MRLFILFTLSLCGAFLNGCDKQKEPLKGTRESVLKAPSVPTQEKIDMAVVLPEAISLTEWFQQGALPALPLRLKDPLTKVTEESVNVGAYPSLLAQPVSDGKRLYVMDGQGTVSAYSLTDPELLNVKWTFSTLPGKTSGSPMGGGISCDQENVYIGSPYGEIICLNAETGAVRWRRNVRNPLRIAPVLKGNYGIALTINNEVEAFSLSNGHHLWTHKGMVEAAGLLKQNYPVVSENVVVVVYSSGEVYALRLENGHPLWAHSLVSGRRFDARSLLMPLSTHCTIHKGHVFISSQNDKMTCIHLWSGKKVWEKNIANLKNFAMIGDYIYGICDHYNLVCLQVSTGKQIWSTPLKAGEEDTEWGQPLVVNDQIFITNTESKGCYYSAIDGRWIKNSELPGPTLMNPLVFGEKMYMLSNDGILSVWK